MDSGRFRFRSGRIGIFIAGVRDHVGRPRPAGKPSFDPKLLADLTRQVTRHCSAGCVNRCDGKPGFPGSARSLTAPASARPGAARTAAPTARPGATMAATGVVAGDRKSRTPACSRLRNAVSVGLADRHHLPVSSPTWHVPPVAFAGDSEVPSFGISEFVISVGSAALQPADCSRRFRLHTAVAARGFSTSGATCRDLMNCSWAGHRFAPLKQRLAPLRFGEKEAPNRPNQRFIAGVGVRVASNPERAAIFAERAAIRVRTRF